MELAGFQNGRNETSLSWAPSLHKSIASSAPIRSTERLPMSIHHILPHPSPRPNPNSEG